MPVIMMSGHATIDTADEATRIGALDFLEKPISLQKLLKAVEQGLTKKAAPPAPPPVRAVAQPVVQPYQPRVLASGSASTITVLPVAHPTLAQRIEAIAQDRPGKLQIAVFHGHPAHVVLQLAGQGGEFFHRQPVAAAVAADQHPNRTMGALERRGAALHRERTGWDRHGLQRLTTTLFRAPGRKFQLAVEPFGCNIGPDAPRQG
jgi:hypothetical protein